MTTVSHILHETSSVGEDYLNSLWQALMGLGIVVDEVVSELRKICDATTFESKKATEYTHRAVCPRVGEMARKIK